MVIESLIFSPLQNTPGKQDATGAFRPAARDFRDLHQQPDNRCVLIDSRVFKKTRATRVSEALGEHEALGLRLNCVAFFCHGTMSGIQLGFDKKNVQELASAIAWSSTEDVVVPLYACSTAAGAPGGDGGFADELRDALCRAGATHCRVFGHDRAGHTTRNPYVRVFEGAGLPSGGPGGQWLVRPGSPQWREWARRCRETDLCLRYPLMTLAELYKELGS